MISRCQLHIEIRSILVFVHSVVLEQMLSGLVIYHENLRMRVHPHSWQGSSLKLRAIPVIHFFRFSCLSPNHDIDVWEKYNDGVISELCLRATCRKYCRICSGNLRVP